MTYVLTQQRLRNPDDTDVSVLCIGTQKQCIDAAKKRWEEYAEEECIGDFYKDDYPLWRFITDDTNHTQFTFEVHRLTVNPDGTTSY